MIESARAIIDEARRSGRARVVYLACRVDELQRRLGGEPGDRPSLTGGDPVDEMATVLAEREPVYRQVADVVLECPEESVPATVGRLRRILTPR